MDQSFLDRLEDIVNANLGNEQFGVVELADEVSMSRFQMHRKLRNSTGQSASQFIREVRLKRSMQLLKKSESTASEIAYRVGFGSPTYFNKCFHDFYKITPGELRKQENLKPKTNDERQASPFDSVEKIGISGIQSGYVSNAENSIVILPFVNMSNDPDQEYFCDGITEEIINTISQYPDIKVIGRTSSFRFKGKNEDLRYIGKLLGVSKVLEGSIRKSGDNIRVTAQLIEASTGFHIWSKKYDRKLVNIFAIQDEIATEIGSMLKLTITPRTERKHTKNIEAYQLYFKGRSLFYQRGHHLHEAVICFKKALEIDNEYALAYSGLADTYIMLIFHGYLPAKEYWPLAINAANLAQMYGEELAETYNTLAIISLFYEWDWKKAEEQFIKAIKSNPVYIQAYNWYGLFYLVWLKYDLKNGINQIKLASEIDPLASYTRTILCWANATAENFDEAYKQGNYANLLDPTSIAPNLSLGQVYFWNGKYKEAIENFEKASNYNLGVFWYYPWCMTYLKANKKQKALKLFANMQKASCKDGLVPTTLAIIHAYMGNIAEATTLLKEACEIKDPMIITFVNSSYENKYLRLIPNCYEILESYGLKRNFPERFK